MNEDTNRRTRLDVAARAITIAVSGGALVRNRENRRPQFVRLTPALTGPGQNATPRASPERPRGRGLVQRPCST